MKKRYILIALLILSFVSVGVFWVTLSNPHPVGKAGKEADALARAMQKAVQLKAWAQTGAISWNFANRQKHLWDRKRQLARVRWGKNEVMFAIGSPTKGIVKVDGKVISDGANKKKLLRQAFAHWCNDSFWLNPLDKLFDKGVTRKIVTKKGQKHLVIEFALGGVTPGDSYYFVLGKDNLPKRWQMFVSNIPVKGIAATFDHWITLPTGAKISTVHKISFLQLKLMDIKAASSLKKLLGKDPFAPLFGKKIASVARRNAASRPVSRRGVLVPQKDNIPTRRR